MSPLMVDSRVSGMKRARGAVALALISGASAVRWTLLVYLMADNDLHCFGVTDLQGSFVRRNQCSLAISAPLSAQPMLCLAISAPPLADAAQMPSALLPRDGRRDGRGAGRLR